MGDNDDSKPMRASTEGEGIDGGGAGSGAASSSKYSQEFKDLLTYVLFLTIFCAVIFAPRTSDPYFLKEGVSAGLAAPAFGDEGHSFRQINSVDEVYTWIEEVAFPYWYPRNDSFADVTLERPLRVYTEGEANLRVGSPRIRFINVDDSQCIVPEQLEDTIPACYPAYSSGAERKNNTGGLSWSDEDETDSLTWYSHNSKLTYAPTGFIKNFPKGIDNATIELNQLINRAVLDESTRVVFVEFFLYNANLDLVASVKFIVEQLATGTTLPSILIRCYPLLRSYRALNGDNASLTMRSLLALEFVLYFFILYYIVQQVITYRTNKKVYWKDAWHYLEVLNLTIFVLWMFMRLSLLGIFSQGVVDEIEDRELEVYPNIEQAMRFYQFTDDLNAFNGVLCFIKVFKLMRTNKKMTQFVDTIKVASGEMLVLSVIIGIVLGGYGLAFHLAFGQSLRNYRDVPESLLTLFEATLGNFNLVELRDANFILGPVLFVTYLISMFYVILSMFLAIVDKSYDEVRTNLLASYEEDNIMRDFKRIYRKVKRSALKCIYFCCPGASVRPQEPVKTAEEESKEREEEEARRAEAEAKNIRITEVYTSIAKELQQLRNEHRKTLNTLVSMSEETDQMQHHHT